MKRRLTAYLTAFWLLLGSAGFAETVPAVAVRVGEYTYSAETVQSSFNSLMNGQAALSSNTLTAADRQLLAEAAIEHFVNIGVLEAKLAETGEREFSREEQEILNAAAQSRYEELWQAAYQQLVKTDPSVTEAQVTEWMAEQGYTAEEIKAEYEVAERQRRAIERYCTDVTLNGQMADAYYENQFVAVDRARYENNIDLFEQEIIQNRNESFFIPAGFRLIRQIVLNYPEEVTKTLKPYEKKVSACAAGLNSALQVLTIAATTAEDWDGVADARAAYDAANADTLAAYQELAQKREEITLPLIKDTLDEILLRYASGEAFADLIQAYSTDRSEENLKGDGYWFHPDSTGWPDKYKEAVAALRQPGDVTDPILTDYGIHIVYYAGDVPAGVHELTDEERDVLNASALYYYQQERLAELIDGWKADYEIETHLELIIY